MGPHPQTHTHTPLLSKTLCEALKKDPSAEMALPTKSDPPCVAAEAPAGAPSNAGTPSNAADSSQMVVPWRYTAYARYCRYLMGHTAKMARWVRYTAYTSDVGEAFRPVVHPMVVTYGYALSWAYVVGDVAVDGVQRFRHGTRGAELCCDVAERATFQAVASMALPAVTIHSCVELSKRVFVRAR